MDIRAYNRKAWNHLVDLGIRWTIPVSTEETAAARQGRWKVLLTPTKYVPANWFPTLTGLELLCLASAGGQQAPLFAAAGAQVTVLDNSPSMLGGDRMVAERDGLNITTLEGDMADLSMFASQTFDLIFHPVSNVFVPDVLPVWKECYRVLKPGGTLMAGITNPLVYLFDQQLLEEKGILTVKYRLPYADPTHLSPGELQKLIDQNEPVEFSHTLEKQIGGQLEAGFVLTGFYEDHDPEDVLSQYTSTFIATRALKPDSS